VLLLLRFGAVRLITPWQTDWQTDTDKQTDCWHVGWYCNLYRTVTEIAVHTFIPQWSDNVRPGRDERTEIKTATTSTVTVTADSLHRWRQSDRPTNGHQWRHLQRDRCVGHTARRTNYTTVKRGYRGRGQGLSVPLPPPGSDHSVTVSCNTGFLLIRGVCENAGYSGRQWRVSWVWC